MRLFTELPGMRRNLRTLKICSKQAAGKLCRSGSSRRLRWRLLSIAFKNLNALERADSARSKALRFLNAIESNLHRSLREDPERHNFPAACLEQIFKVRKFLRMPGSSVKSLMESVALTLPVL